MNTQSIILIIGLFGIFGKQSTEPYKNKGINQIYELLFCDNLEKYKSANENPSIHPWNVLFAESSDEQLNELINDDETESRVKALAYHKLKQKTDKKDLLGVLIEVSQPEGLDVLAAYSDGTARYINYSEKMIVWETSSKDSERLIKYLFESSQFAITLIDSWKDKRTRYPKKGNIRLTFLVSDQLHIGEAPIDLISDIPFGESIFNDGAMLMQYLISKTEEEDH